jgi:xanthine dehydrogenase accessory factor
VSTAALQATAREWLARGVAAIEVRVAQARGSAPREAGTRMLVSAHEAAATGSGGRRQVRGREVRGGNLAAG